MGCNRPTLAILHVVFSAKDGILIKILQQEKVYRSKKLPT